jgi:hypothetical protein
MENVRIGPAAGIDRTDSVSATYYRVVNSWSTLRFNLQGASLRATTRRAHARRALPPLGGAAALRVRASADEEPGPGGPLLNQQFMGVLQQSLARQGADALTRAPAVPAEDRVTAVEEVLQSAVNQSRQTLQMLERWRLQIDAQVAAQEKQVERMEFALYKARNDAAYMRTLKSMLYDSGTE